MTGVLHSLRFKRDHLWAPAHMSEYLDGQLRPGPRGRLQRHTEECQDCRGVLAGLRRLIGALHELPGTPAGARTPDIASAVRSRLHQPRRG